MSDAEKLKQRLLNRTWPEYTRVSVEVDEGEKVELVIRRPPDSVLQKILGEARDKGLAAADGDAKDPVAALLFRAQVVAATVFLSDAVRPLFTPEEALEFPGISEVAEHCMAAINPAKGLEAARGH